jgi:hypothetical protein
MREREGWGGDAGGMLLFDTGDVRAPRSEEGGFWGYDM